MTDTSRHADVVAWHLDLMRKIDAQRAQWAAEAQVQAARPLQVRRQALAARRFGPAGPPDAAEQAWAAEAARRLAESREMALQKMEQTAMDIVRMTEG